MNLDLEILRALRGSSQGGVSGAELSQRLSVSRAAVWARIRELRALGYEIVASPHLGYTLVSAPDLLHADDLLARLGAVRVIGRDIRVFEQTTSTNDVIEKLARDGAKEGAVVFAESQTRGRGRLGRQWISPARKGLWFSILLRPNLRPQEATRITIAAAVALRRAIHNSAGLDAQIKWPNDILVGGRKLSGILTELRGELDRVQYVILGIGVDVNLSAVDFPPGLRKTATSIRAELGRVVSRADLAVNILRELDSCYALAGGDDFSRLADQWVEHCMTIGCGVVVQSGQRVIEGVAESLADDGSLQVRTEHGRIERVTAGEVVSQKD
jgi:BirA family biotin operon repressor/biotin-[acetyl-CoA-carboxylase] ligase